MWVPEIRMTNEEIYNKHINKYKKEGNNYEIYYKGNLTKLKDLSDEEIQYELDRIINKSTIFLSNKLTVKIKILEHYKTYRRTEKILKIKDNICKKENYLLYLWNLMFKKKNDCKNR